MYFKSILGNENVKQILIKEISEKKIPHAQLFTHPFGLSALPFALAFSMYLLCEHKNNQDSCGQCSNCIKMLKVNHPDLHLFYPTKGTNTKKSGSKENFSIFQQFLIKNPNMVQDDWANHVGLKNNGEIRVADAKIINYLANLRSYEGGYKIFIIWQPETMNHHTANKLLKNIEEPNHNTVFILITDKPHLLLPTIYSRLQVKKLHKISSNKLINDLTKQNPEIDIELIKKHIAESDGNYNNILKKLSGELNQCEHHNEFIDWIRLCFLSINKKATSNLIDWCNNIAACDQNTQLQFLKTSSDIFRHAFLLKYNPSIKLYPEIKNPDFNMINFSNRIQGHNIFDICKALDDAHYSLKRYANSKILFLDLSFSLGLLLHKKPN